MDNKQYKEMNELYFKILPLVNTETVKSVPLVAARDRPFVYQEGFLILRQEELAR